jgi:tetrapyrrole methylase family protein/MazG family protein
MNIDKLQEIMDALRGPDGCPWDRQQTRKTLIPFLIEETYEVVEALQDNDPVRIREELGDLLFQIVFHSRIAKENGEFTMDDVVAGIHEKMVSRHPHVFGDTSCNTSEEVLKQWDAIKKREGKFSRSLLDGVPNALPSLMRAQMIQHRASKSGFDWHKTEEVVEKLDEEVEEFKAALKTGDHALMEEELGDMLFTVVNISRFIKVNPEDALRRTIDRFVRRFEHMEGRAKDKDSGRDFSSLTPAQMDELWEESKRCT